MSLRPAALAWRAGHGRAPELPLAVVSRGLDLDPDARMFPASPRTVVLTCAASPAAARQSLARVADVVVVGGEDVDLGEGLDALADRGLARVLCEGGPRLLGDVVRAGRLTELCATLSPLLVGDPRGLLGGGLPAPVRLDLVHLLEEEGTLLARWRVRGAGG